MRHAQAPPDMFAPGEALRVWADQLTAQQGTARLHTLVQLAWHLRQRDTPQALRHVEEAVSLLPTLALPAAAAAPLSARLDLVRAEADWLAADLAAAQDRAQRALLRLADASDAHGCADAHWLLAFIAADQGDLPGRDGHLQQALDQAQAAGDPLRVGVIEAAQARFSVLRDAQAADARWRTHWPEGEAGAPPRPAAIDAWVQDFRGLLAGQQGDLPRSTVCLVRAHEAALASGQMQRAILIAGNIGTGMNSLGDHEAALEWMQRGLELARPAAWPASLGLSLMQAGETLRLLGRVESGEAWLGEALATLAPLAGSRLYVMALMYLGEVAMDKGQPAVALGRFEQVQQRADALKLADLQMSSRGGQARALAQLGQPRQALAVAHAGLGLAQARQDVARQVTMLGVLAELHAGHDLRHDLPNEFPNELPQDPALAAPSAALHYLHQALAVAAGTEGLTVTPEMLQAAAHEHARLGQHAKAYEMALKALEAVQNLNNRNTASRATAMEIRHQAERSQAELQHHRALAAAEAQRAATLQQTGHTLKRLSAVGQEITGHLESGAIVQTLARHVHSLLDASAFAIYLATPDDLQPVFGLGLGGAGAVSLADPRSEIARCARERRELLAETGTEPHALSRLCVPMLIGERLLGVMVLQSAQRQAFAERERLVCRTLCAYAAIALDNAQAYAQLRHARDQLVDKEKLAALGALVAGVAHELNTPIGNSLLIASTLRDKTHELAGKVKNEQIKRSDLHAFVDEADEGFDLILSGLASAAGLVNSFKQVAVDQTSEQRRRFALRKACQDVVAAMAAKIRGTGHTIELDIAPELMLDSYPGPLGQVLSNLIDNSLIHAFADGTPGRMRLSARQAAPGHVQLLFSDNGCGISAEHLKRVFEPFFTTRLGQGGSGLGLSISYNIVSSLLQGQISVESPAGQGTVFTLDLPLSAGAPATAPAG